MLKNDRWISEQASLGMLEPFQEKLIRHLEPETKKSPVLSFGCSSYGYDLRLSSKEFLIFRHVPGTVMNPKKFNPANLEPTDLKEDEDGKYFILDTHYEKVGETLNPFQADNYQKFKSDFDDCDKELLERLKKECELILLNNR